MSEWIVMIFYNIILYFLVFIIIKRMYFRCTILCNKNWFSISKMKIRISKY